MNRDADDVAAEKWALREAVWQRLSEARLARFPLPIRGRIPNFKGAESAADRLAGLPEFQQARAVKVNPDAPQRPVRELVLRSGKTLLMPTPRLREGFLLLDPAQVGPGLARRASTIRGAFDLARHVGLDELPTIDLIVVGSVVVSIPGARLGKGEGYAELEYATLRQLGLIDPGISVVTTVHDAQLAEGIPLQPFDVPVDIIVTPTRVLRTSSVLPKPAGILWEHLAPERLEAMPILKELRDRQ